MDQVNISARNANTMLEVLVFPSFLFYLPLGADTNLNFLVSINRSNLL